MEISKAKMKQIRNLMLLAAVLILLVANSKATIAGLQLLTKVLTPVIAGGIVAFILNLPMRAYERLLFGKAKRKFALAMKRPVCYILAFITVGLIVAGVLLTVIPQITETVGILGKKIPIFMEDAIAFLEKMAKDYPQLNDLIASLENNPINWDTMLDKVGSFLKDGVSNVLNSTFSVASGLVSGVANGIIALIFSIYILFQKEKLANQGTRIVTAYLPEKSANNVLRVLGILQRNFSNFITGQCIEALVIGTLIFVSMSIFRMPYAPMIAVLTAFTSLVPIVGAFVGCVVGAFLILIENPVTAFWFVIMFLILQQIEGNLIYPKVVGNSVGLPSLWVLFAVTVGGSLFGIMGILCFIPILSTVYFLLRENVDARNAAKQAENKVCEVSEEQEKEE